MLQAVRCGEDQDAFAPWVLVPWTAPLIDRPSSAPIPISPGQRIRRSTRFNREECASRSTIPGGDEDFRFLGM